MAEMGQNYDRGDYNRGGMIAFVFSMGITLIFFIYVAFVHKGVDLGELPPPAPEKDSQTPLEDKDSSEE